MRSILKAEKQLKRVDTLLEMAKEKLSDYYKDCKDYEEWKNEKRNELWYDGEFRTNKTEIKRIMLVLRQETIKLEKLL